MNDSDKFWNIDMLFFTQKSRWRDQSRLYEWNPHDARLQHHMSDMTHMSLSWLMHIIHEVVMSIIAYLWLSINDMKHLQPLIVITCVYTRDTNDPHD